MVSWAVGSAEGFGADATLGGLGAGVETAALGAVYAGFGAATTGLGESDTAFFVALPVHGSTSIYADSSLPLGGLPLAMSTAIGGALGGCFLPHSVAPFGFFPTGTFGFLCAFIGFGKAGLFDDFSVASGGS